MQLALTLTLALALTIDGNLGARYNICIYARMYIYVCVYTHGVRCSASHLRLCTQ